MKKTMVVKGIKTGAVLLAALAALAVAACSPGGKGLPTPLPENASKNQVVAAVDKIAAYCEARAKVDPEYAADYTSAGASIKLLSLVSVISDADWRDKRGPSTVAAINKIIAALEKMEAKRKEGK